EVETADGRRLNAFNPRQKSSFEQPLRTQRMFNSVMGEYFKHGMFVEADPASAESQIVARTLLEYFARQLHTKWEQLEPAKVRVYRMLKQAPNPLRPDAHRMKLIHKVGEHDIATGQFEPADKFAYGILYRSDGTRYREGSVEWKTMLEQGRWLTYRPDGKT